MDLASLRALHDAHYRSLVKLAALYLDDVGACEEVVQDAFLAVVARPPEVKAGREVAYLRAAVLNRARSVLRHRLVRERATLVVVDIAPAADTDAVAHDERERVLAIVRSLPAGQADVLVLRYFCDLSEAEIADTLGIARGTVKSHAHRGLARLAELMRHELVEDER